MDTYMVVLRIVHILAGAFWIGAALSNFLFIAPTAREIGPAAGPFMMHLAARRRFTEAVLIAGLLTVLAGVLMYWRVSSGFDPDWIGSATGLTLTVGALCAIAALVLGATVVRPSVNRVMTIGNTVAASGGAPTPEQGAEIQALQQRVRSTGTAIVPLLIVAVIGMASFRYL